MDNGFGKSEKLKRRDHITALFANGKSLKKFPLKLIYLPLEDESQNKVGVSVPKRRFKHAVDRNRLKRLMREGYRLNKKLLTTEQSYAMMWIYLGDKKTDFEKVSKSVESILLKLAKTSTS